MKNKNNIYIAFIVLAATFWNPLTFSLVYRNSDIHTSNIAKALFWFLFIASIALCYLIKKNKVGNRSLNMLFFFSFLGIFYAFLVGLDLLLSDKNIRKGPVSHSGIIFEPGSKARYQTTEFDFTVSANSLGLRDKEIQKNKKGKRILCFGDSWTMGWGVAAEHSWPKQLEQYLALNKQDIEVINCGQAGQYTTVYKKYVTKAVPMLKPDIVIIGVLQLDDLAQLYETNYDPKRIQTTEEKPSGTKVAGNMLKLFLATSFKNIISLAQKNTKKIEMKNEWQTSVNTYLNSLTDYQYLRYLTFNDTVRQMFETGNLNPGLLSNYVNFSDRVTLFNDPTNKATQFAIKAMVDDLAEMKKVCVENNAQMIFVNLPSSWCTGHNTVRIPLAPIMTKYLEENNHVDSIYASVAHTVGIPYFELTENFKSLPDKSSYFFRFDGHPTKKGYEQIAKYIGDHLINNSNLN